MIQVSAPGKLFIAGEYAVVEPGEPAVLVAVDRYLTVRLTPSATGDTGSVLSPEYGQQPLVWTRTPDGLSVVVEHTAYDYVLAVIRVIERLREERAITPRFYDLRITSELDDVSGRKFGLGSSAAVTVAVVRALDAFYELGLDRRAVYQLALTATVQLAPTASGGDLAASAFGGWIGYRAPDRALLRAQARAGSITQALACSAWDSLEITRLDPPDHLRLLVGWTGEPASTERFVDRVQHGRDEGRFDHARFLASSAACVEDLMSALQDGRDERALDAIRRARRVLQDLGERTGVPIETERLGVLCDAAERADAAAKPSGAGGGDCGIVLAPPDARVGEILREWETHDIRHLSIAVHPAEGDDHEPGGGNRP